MAPAWAGQRGKLSPVFIANAFHNMLHATLAKLRGLPSPIMQTPLMQMLTGNTSYVKVRAAFVVSSVKSLVLAGCAWQLELLCAGGVGNIKSQQAGCQPDSARWCHADAGCVAGSCCLVIADAHHDWQSSAIAFFLGACLTLPILRLGSAGRTWMKDACIFHLPCLHEWLHPLCAHDGARHHRDAPCSAHAARGNSITAWLRLSG